MVLVTFVSKVARFLGRIQCMPTTRQIYKKQFSQNVCNVTLSRLEFYSILKELCQNGSNKFLKFMPIKHKNTKEANKNNSKTNL